MSALQEEYDAFAREVQVGYLHQGGDCPGWFVSGVDTVHWCGACNSKGLKKPNPYEDSPELPEEPKNVHLDQPRFVVQAELGNHARWAHAMFFDIRKAQAWAKEFAKRNRKTAWVVKVTMTQELEDTEFQLEKLADWASD
jgi:hypothetical protein